MNTFMISTFYKFYKYILRHIDSQSCALTNVKINCFFIIKNDDFFFNDFILELILNSNMVINVDISEATTKF